MIKNLFVHTASLSDKAEQHHQIVIQNSGIDAIESCAFLLAWVSLKLFIPKIEPLKMKDNISNKAIDQKQIYCTYFC